LHGLQNGTLKLGHLDLVIVDEAGMVGTSGDQHQQERPPDLREQSTVLEPVIEELSQSASFVLIHHGCLVPPPGRAKFAIVNPAITAARIPARPLCSRAANGPDPQIIGRTSDEVDILNTNDW
jgi:hypothetical protein